MLALFMGASGARDAHEAQHSATFRVVDELTYMHRLWGFGQGKSEDCGSPRGIVAIVAKDTAPPTKGDKVTSPAPEAPRKDKHA
jgi:hypothetical protein